MTTVSSFFADILYLVLLLYILHCYEVWRDSSKDKNIIGYQRVEWLVVITVYRELFVNEIVHRFCESWCIREAFLVSNKNDT